MSNSIIEDVDEFGKIGAETSCLQSQMHSEHDSEESIADSDLEDGELRKNAGFTSRISTAPGKLIKEREEQVQCVLKLITREEKA